MKFWPIKVVAEKELKDGVRDRRSLYTILAPIVFGPIVLSFLVHKLGDVRKPVDEIRIPVSGVTSAPVLVDWLRLQSGVTIAAASSNSDSSVRSGKEDYVLVVDKDFARDFSESKPATVQVLFDSTRSSTQPELTRLLSLLRRFSSEMATLRLITHGVSPLVVAPVKVSEVDISTSEQRAATTLNIILMFSVVTLMTAGMQIATDSTAGERERKSLEPLLVNPVPRWQLITGKWLAAALCAFAGLVGCLFVMSAAIARLPLENLGVRFDLTTLKILVLILTISPLALLVPAIQTYLSCRTKSFKEAQSYSVFLVLPVAFAGMISISHPLANQSWMLGIPLLAQYSIGEGVLAGNIPSAPLLIGTALESVALATVFLWLAARRFSSETTIFAP